MSKKVLTYHIKSGAQVLGKVQQLTTGQEGSHKFMGSHSKSFRVANDKNLTYQWSIYRYTSDSQEEYLESSSFNIKNRFQEYLQQIQKIQVDLYRIYNEKQKKTQIEQIWKDLRYDLTKSQFQMSCTFTKLNAKVNFNMKINCEFDFRYEKWEEEREKRRLARTVNGTRKGSVDSRNRTLQIPSFLEVKDKTIQQSNQPSQQQPFLKPVSQKGNQEKGKRQVEQEQDLQESQIRVTDPEGVDVTDEIPQKFVNHKPTDSDDYHYRKKSSMLSDIIEESYEGSSNVFTKSNQGEKLKSVDEIHQEDESPLFSPLIKTQNYDSHKDQDYCDVIKRTATLMQRPSQEFDMQQTSKVSYKKSNPYFPTVQHRNQQNKREEVKDDNFLYETRRLSSRKSSETEEQQNQMIDDFNEARKHTIKNLIKVLIIVVLLVVVINSWNLFEQGDKKENNEKRKVVKNQHKGEKDISNKQKTSKVKSDKNKQTD